MYYSLISNYKMKSHGPFRCNVKVNGYFRYKTVENYSLFVGINVYLPRIIVRIFVDFD